MTLLKIARMGHPVLLQTAEVIADPMARNVGRLLEDMVETMEDAAGVGLAAPQVYEGKRVIIFKSPRERGEDGGAESDFSPLTALINPEFEPVQENSRLVGKVACRSLGSLVPFLGTLISSTADTCQTARRSSARQRIFTPGWCSMRLIIWTAFCSPCG